MRLPPFVPNDKRKREDHRPSHLDMGWVGLAFKPHTIAVERPADISTDGGGR